MVAVRFTCGRKCFFLLAFTYLSFIESSNGQQRKMITISIPAPGRQKEVYEELTDRPGIKDGSYKRYRYKKLVESGFYKDGLKDSTWKIYSRKKQLMAEGSYRRDRMSGLWNYFSTGGVLVQTYDHDRDSLVYFNVDEEAKMGHAPSVWPDTAGEQLPLFIGGTAYMNTVIENNMVYPKTAWDKSLHAKLTLMFTVDSLGNTTNVKCLKRAGNGFDEEGIRLVSLFGRAWIPGRQKGRRVNVLFSIPLSFVLE